MKQNLYTCCRCGAVQRTAADQKDAPLGWAEIDFRRNFVDTIDGERHFLLTTLTTHACGQCHGEVIEFLEKVVPDREPPAPVDDLFDKGSS